MLELPLENLSRKPCSWSPVSPSQDQSAPITRRCERLFRKDFITAAEGDKAPPHPEWPPP